MRASAGKTSPQEMRAPASHPSRPPRPSSPTVNDLIRPTYVTLGSVRYGVRLAPLTPSAAAATLAAPAAPCCCCWTGSGGPDDSRRTLERLQRLRLGRGPSAEPALLPSSSPAAVSPRRAERTLRLRELTERLRGPRNPQTPTAPPPPPPPPVPPPRHRNAVRTPPIRPTPLPPEKPRGPVVQRNAEIFHPDDIKVAKVEPRAIIGSYAQKTIPFRSASFSQVDFNLDDGKYIRSLPRNFPTFKTIQGQNNRHTKTFCSVETSTSSLKEEPSEINQILEDIESIKNSTTNSSPSNLEENNYKCECFPSSPLGETTSTISEATSPGDRDTDEPFLFSSPLNFSPMSSLDLGENASNRNSAEYSQARVYMDTADGRVLTTANATTIPVPVYECIVKEWSSRIPSGDWVQTNEVSNNINVDKNSVNCDCKINSSDQICTDERVGQDEIITSEQVDKLLESVQNQTKIPPPAAEEKKRVFDKSKRRKGIYITKWPIQDESGSFILPELVIGKNKSDEDDNGEMSVISNACADVRESSGKGTGCSDNLEDRPETLRSIESSPSTPPTPPTNSFRSSRPTLVYQSSEERDDGKYSPSARVDSTSEGESESIRDRTISPSPQNTSISDNCDGGAKKERAPRRYSKRPLRGPYGQMLEAEMKKPELPKLTKHEEELRFLDDLMSSQSELSKRDDEFSIINNLMAHSNRRPLSPGNPRTRSFANRSLDDTQLTGSNLSASNNDSLIRQSPKRKASANIPYSAPNPSVFNTEPARSLIFHQRTTSSPSKLEGAAAATASSSRISGSGQVLMRGSSERLSTNTTHSSDSPLPLPLQHWTDTRTHVVVELFDTERSYVEALQILVKKYLQPLKSPENAGLVEAAVVDDMFYQVPAILSLHERFLDELRRRLERWTATQNVGDLFLSVFATPAVMETYTAFINNWMKARETIKATAAAKPAFARFLDAMARDHKGRLSLDNLLIKPVQKFPKYEMLIQRLIKHTDPSHTDYQLLLDAEKEIHELLLRINCTERETLELEQQQQTLRDLEALVEGLNNLIAPDRIFIRHDNVQMPSGQGTAKERALFLFSDLLIITSVKKRTAAIRKPALSCQSNLVNILESNKYKLLMRIPIEDLDIVKGNCGREESLITASSTENMDVMERDREKSYLSDDAARLRRVAAELSSLHILQVPTALSNATANSIHPNLHATAVTLVDSVKDLLKDITVQLAEKDPPPDTDRLYLAVSVNGIDNLTIIFLNPEKKTSWEEAFNEAKQKMNTCEDRRTVPEFVVSVPVRKTRAGLQFTCAAPSITTAPPAQSVQPNRNSNGSSINLTSAPDVWVCNSDGYVGQVCVLSLTPEPQVTSCNGVCNARILCVACVPPAPSHSSQSRSQAGDHNISINVQDTEQRTQNIRFDSSSSSSEDDDQSSADEKQEEKQPSDVPSKSEKANPPPRNKTLSHMQSTSLNSTLIPNHSKSPSLPHTGNPIHPVMKSNSNPTVDKMAMGISLGINANSSTSISEKSLGPNGPCMWLGTEDGCIHMFGCGDNIRLKKNKVKLQHTAAVYSIVYVDEKVYVALANGEIVVYVREENGVDGGWKEGARTPIGSGSSPVIKMVAAAGRLWCAHSNTVKVVERATTRASDVLTDTLASSQSGQCSSVPLRICDTLPAGGGGSVTHLAIGSGGASVWAATARSAELRAWDARTRRTLARVDLAPTVNKMLQGCDDIIRQHKAACLRVTALSGGSTAVTSPSNDRNDRNDGGDDMVWVGTSAGVLLTAHYHHPHVNGLHHGHTGHVRFITVVEGVSGPKGAPGSNLVISGGDGYEDFRNSGVSDIAGREDSTNHLLLWKI